MFAEWKKSVHKSQDTEVRKKDPGPDLMKLTFWWEETGIKQQSQTNTLRLVVISAMEKN